MNHNFWIEKFLAVQYIVGMCSCQQQHTCYPEKSKSTSSCRSVPGRLNNRSSDEFRFVENGLGISAAVQYRLRKCGGIERTARRGRWEEIESNRRRLDQGTTSVGPHGPGPSRGGLGPAPKAAARGLLDSQAAAVRQSAAVRSAVRKSFFPQRTSFTPPTPTPPPTHPLVFFFFFHTDPPLSSLFFSTPAR